MTQQIIILILTLTDWIGGLLCFGMLLTNYPLIINCNGEKKFEKTGVL